MPRKKKLSKEEKAQAAREAADRAARLKATRVTSWTPEYEREMVGKLDALRARRKAAGKLAPPRRQP